jgi:hypothetical protein
LISVLSAGWLCDRREGSGTRRNAASTMASVTWGGATIPGGPLPEQTSPLGPVGGGVSCQSWYICWPAGHVFWGQVGAPVTALPMPASAQGFRY